MLANGQPAAGCRLTFPLFNNAPTAFTTHGWALFDAAVGWAADGCADDDRRRRRTGSSTSCCSRSTG